MKVCDGSGCAQLPSIPTKTHSLLFSLNLSKRNVMPVVLEYGDLIINQTFICFVKFSIAKRVQHNGW